MEKIKIGVSACLLGAKVRYDGGHKLNRLIVDTLGERFALVPVCPEAEAGLPVPREPMQLTGMEQEPRLLVISSGLDLTAAVHTWSEKKVRMLRQEAVCGFILKARSPSCAINDADYYSSSGEKRGTTAGIFSAALERHDPGMPLIDEEDFADPALQKSFIERVSCCRQSR